MGRDDQKAYYRELIAQHGNRREIAGWGSQASQERRFAVFARHLPLQGARIVDVGCGRGDLFGYLKSTGQTPGAYVGLDLMEEALTFGRANHPDGQFLCGDLLDPEISLPDADYVLSSGIFNLDGPDHGQWIADMAKVMFCAARRGAAFNMISRFAPEHKPDHYYADPAGILAMAQEITPFVTLVHDYAIHDMTVLLSHEEIDL